MKQPLLFSITAAIIQSSIAAKINSINFRNVAFISTPRHSASESSRQPVTADPPTLLHPSLPSFALHSSSGEGFGSTDNNQPKYLSPKKSPSSSYELFELQELRAQLKTMMERDLPFQSLSLEKREELSGYVRAVLEKTPGSPIDFADKGMGTAKFVAGIENKSWRLIFSTDSDKVGIDSGSSAGGPAEIPYGSTVILRMGELKDSEGKMDYVLKFSKRVLGLNELVAKSTWSIDIGPINPGLVTFVYQDIQTKIFGMSNLPVGFFGLLKGRANFIDTVWFDGERWIDRTYLEDGSTVYGIYVRDLKDENANEKDKR